tara:strand:+ start:580 stop:786 length:207 start_codon:yes stop_codon:yes gene_type:complete
MVHVLLKNKWTKYNLRSFLSKVFFHTIQIAMDIIRYKVDQIGANTQLGGLKLGRISSEYHGSLNADVE